MSGRAGIHWMAVAMLGVAGCCGVSSTGSCLRSRAIRAAGANGDDAQLRAWLRDERSWVREEAALTAGQSDRRSLAPDVQARLLDPGEASWVRAAAARATGALGAGDPETLVGVALEPKTPPEVKIALIEALCRSAPEVAPTLIAPLVSDADVLVAAAAQRQVQTQCDAR